MHWHVQPSNSKDYHATMIRNYWYVHPHSIHYPSVALPELIDLLVSHSRGKHAVSLRDVNHSRKAHSNASKYSESMLVPAKH